MYLLCDMAEELDGAAERVRAALNLPATNKLPHEENQKRYGLNIGGGHYYRFDVLGIELCLCCNEGEVAFAKESEWPYYLWVDTIGDFSDLFRHTAERLNTSGIPTKLLNAA